MVEIVNNSYNLIIESVYEIASKSEYIDISEEYIKYYIEDKLHKVAIIKNKENNIYGFLIYFILPPEIDIIFIASYPNNKGYGKKLLSYLFDDAKNNGVKSIKLDLHENNLKAKKFYINNGFNIIASRKKYYNNKFDCYIMEKIL